MEYLIDLDADHPCTGCMYDMPGDCATRVPGEDGYLHFPEEPCFTEVAK